MEEATVDITVPIRLTDRGWPRPRDTSLADGRTYPVAWVTEAPYFAQISTTRAYEMRDKRLCQVCGEGHDPGARVVLFLTGDLRSRWNFDPFRSPEEWSADLRSEVVLRCLDDGILHDRCAKLAVGTCPHLKRARDGERLFGFTVPVEDVHLHKGGVDYLYALAEHAEVWHP